MRPNDKFTNELSTQKFRHNLLKNLRLSRNSSKESLNDNDDESRGKICKSCMSKEKVRSALAQIQGLRRYIPRKQTSIFGK